MNPEECSKLDTCSKAKMVFDHDLLEFQYAEALRKVCGECTEGEKKVVGTPTTLTEMLSKALFNSKPETQAEKEANFYEVEAIKRTFKEWLFTVGLPDYDGITEGGNIFSATKSLRKLLITLVDEP